MDLFTYQKALYDAIKSLGYDVYDYVPLDAPMPFVRLDYNLIMDDGTKTTEGYEILQYINIFSDYNGQKESKDMAQKIYIKTKEIEGLSVRLHSLEFRQQRDKVEKMQGTTLGTYYQATLILKIKI